MTLYTQSTNLPNVQWPEPMETVWQVLPSGPGVPGSKIPHLSLADELFVAAVAQHPAPRPAVGRHHVAGGCFSDFAAHDLCAGPTGWAAFGA